MKDAEKRKKALAQNSAQIKKETDITGASDARTLRRRNRDKIKKSQIWAQKTSVDANLLTSDDSSSEHSSEATGGRDPMLTIKSEQGANETSGHAYEAGTVVSALQLRASKGRKDRFLNIKNESSDKVGQKDPKGDQCRLVNTKLLNRKNTSMNTASNRLKSKTKQIPMTGGRRVTRDFEQTAQSIDEYAIPPALKKARFMSSQTTRRRQE